MLVDRISNARANQVWIWPSHDAHQSSASSFFEARELRLVKSALSWNESTLYVQSYCRGTEPEIKNPVRNFQSILYVFSSRRPDTKLYCGFAIKKNTNLKIEVGKCVVIMKYVLLRNAVHMPKEERLRTAKLQHTVTSLKTRVPQDLSTHAKEPISFQKASE